MERIDALPQGTCRHPREWRRGPENFDGRNEVCLLCYKTWPAASLDRPIMHEMVSA